MKMEDGWDECECDSYREEKEEQWNNGNFQHKQEKRSHGKKLRRELGIFHLIAGL